MTRRVTTINRTVYSTHALRRFISAVLKREEFPTRKKRGLVIDICYCKVKDTPETAGFSGEAIVGGRDMVLRLPRDLGKRKMDLPYLGFLVAHEARHIEGQDHRDMPTYLLQWDDHWIEQHWGWTRTLTIVPHVAAWRRRVKRLPKKKEL